jgi:hypothetical protein
MIHAIIKGNAQEALQAATRRGLHATVISSRAHDTTLALPCDTTPVAKWFCQAEPKPAPIGSCLYYWE